jgi:bacterioferritin-associated ferredoxin
MTVGALQILLKSAALAPAAPCILAGSGPLLYLVAAQLTRLGRPPAAVLDTAMRPTLRAIAAMPAGLWAARRQLIIGAGLMATLVKARVPVWHGAGEIEAHGDGKLAGITFRARGRTHALDAEVLGLHGGLMPNIQLSAALDLPHDYDPLRRYWLPCADTWGQTSRPGISVAGDCAGIVGAAGSEADGELAAAGVAAQLGRISADERDRVTRTLHQRQRKLRSAQQTLEAVFPPWQLPGPIPPTTVICRCESVSVGDIRGAVRAGARNAAEAKTFTRCGMGPCQGRMCGTLLSQVLADALTKPAADVGFLKPRWPLEPIDFASLAALDEQVS